MVFRAVFFGMQTIRSFSRRWKFVVFYGKFGFGGVGELLPCIAQSILPSIYHSHHLRLIKFLENLCFWKMEKGKIHLGILLITSQIIFF